MFSLGLGIGLGTVRRGASAPVSPSAPNFLIPPLIEGDVTEGSILTVVPGTVAGYPAPTRSYQWKADGSNVGTNSTSFDTTGQSGAIITVVETATNSEGSDSETSADFGPIGGPAIDPEQPTFIGVNADGAYTGADGDGSGMRDGLDNIYGSVWASNTTAGSLTAILGGDFEVGYIRLMPIDPALDGWGPAYLNGASVARRPAAGGAWTTIETVSGATTGEYVDIDLSAATMGEIKVEMTGEYLGIAEFIVSTDILPPSAPPSDQARLREDGGYRLRENGSSYRLTENP